ncbi:hypothetical protein L9F63_000642, partial [Diploptera punctata]
MDKEVLEIHGDPVVGTVVKLNPDGYGSHTSPAHHCTRYDDFDEEPFLPKNAKTSLFIIMSFIYAKLLVVICIAYVISEVVTNKLPLHYYESWDSMTHYREISLFLFCVTQPHLMLSHIASGCYNPSNQAHTLFDKSKYYTSKLTSFKHGTLKRSDHLKSHSSSLELFIKSELWLTMNMIMFEIAISWKHESYEYSLRTMVPWQDTTNLGARHMF